MSREISPPPFLAQRRAGALLHISSLPADDNGGRLGESARRFVDFLVASGFSVWQMLPMGPTHDDGSPYQCLSAHAGNVRFVSRRWLQQQGLLTAADSQASLSDCLSAACGRLAAHALWPQYERFCKEHAYWLDDYALFTLLREMHQHRGWSDWPAEYRDRQPQALRQVSEQYAPQLEQIRFGQFVFHRQWSELKDYANRHGVLLFGDLPIFVAYDSADVWARREQFALDAAGRARIVAGVPPDYFSATGQRWGNPHYDWSRMQQDDFAWWQQRIASQLELYDLLRIDHFRGFEAYWSIPASDPVATNGHWVQAPGDALFAAIERRFGKLPFVAEDLGVITDAVTALRLKYALPGMKIMQFAFDSDSRNPYLPHNHELNSVVYTGTHDNDTLQGWFGKLSREQQQRIAAYFNHPVDAIPWVIIAATLASVSRLAMVPVQDLLLLDGGHRMNTPGTTSGNWSWTFSWSMMPDDLPARLRAMTGRYGRV